MAFITSPSSLGIERAAAPDLGNRSKAVACKLASMVVFTVMAALIKAVGPRIPVGEVVFCRSLFAFIPLLLMLPRHGGVSAFRTLDPLGHGLRALAGMIAMACGFWALAILPLAQTTAIGFAAPLFTVALAWPLLGERIGWVRASCVLGGFVGVLVILRPGDFSVSAGSLVALAGAFFTALAMIAIKRMAGREQPMTIVLYFTTACVVASGMSLLVRAVMPRPVELAMLVGIGVLGGIGQLLLTTAYRHAPASVIAPLDYGALILASLIGMAVWAEQPTFAMLLGALIVIASGLGVLWSPAGRRCNEK